MIIKDFDIEIQNRTAREWYDTTLDAARGILDRSLSSKELINFKQYKLDLIAQITTDIENESYNE